jgi:hypothetical protein
MVHARTAMCMRACRKRIPEKIGAGDECLFARAGDEQHARRYVVRTWAIAWPSSSSVAAFNAFNAFGRRLRKRQ